jgi:predicted transcriptional regulator
MDHQDVTLRLSTPTLTALRQIAGAEDVTVGQVVRDAIAIFLDRKRSAKTPVRADERLVASLRSLLAQDFADAVDWADLSFRLRTKGYHVAEAGGGLIVTDRDGGRLCKGSELGYPYALLARRFAATFPGQRHGTPERARAPEVAAPRG